MINRKEQSVIQACYDWVWKLSGYLIFATALLQIVPGEKNRKYIHFFTGLVLIVMVATPVLKLFTSEDSFAKFQSQYDAMEAQVEEMLKSSAAPEDDSNGGEEGGKESGIRVEEIRIGRDGENP